MSITLYILWSIIVIMRISLGSFEVLGLALVMILVALIIKDVLLYGVEIKPSNIKTYDFKLLTKDKVSRFSRFLLTNKIYIFPSLWTIALIFDLIGKTQVRQHFYASYTNSLFDSIQNIDILAFLVIFEGFPIAILWACIILSGLGFLRSFFTQKTYKKYEITKESLMYTRIYLGFAITISLWTVDIISIQVVSLGWIGYVISGIAGIAVFLLSLLILLKGSRYFIQVLKKLGI